MTILSTLPPAGLGALIALKYTNTDLTLIAFIGIILLIGIVKKNGIMLVDQALELEHRQGRDPEYCRSLRRRRGVSGQSS